ncbi:MAG: PEP-CTERM sorting domain-containing protein [Leptolyngbya sp. BL-A-14]
MSKKTLKSLAAATASVAILSALQTKPAQAAVLTYTSDLNITSTVLLPNQSTVQAPVANASVTFLKVPSVVQPGLFDYTFTSFTASFLSTPYTLSDLLTPTNVALAQSLSPFLPTEYQGKYQTLVSNLVSGTVPTYTGDGDFPPATPISYAFSGKDVSAGVSSVTPYLSTEQLSLVSTIASLFPNGGEATFSSTLIASSDPGSGSYSSEGAPEPTTMAGLALAGAGMMAARRRLSKRKIAA